MRDIAGPRATGKRIAVDSVLSTTEATTRQAFVALCGAAISVLFFWPAYEMLG
jgi:hypothetical protein